MNKWLQTKLRPMLGSIGRERFPKLYKMYEKLFWSIVIRIKNRALHKSGYECLREVEKVLNDAKISYFITYGTLLGIIREGKFIAHDNDIDISVLDINDFSWSNLEKVLKTIGLVKKHQFILDGEITEQTYKKGNLSIDFFMSKIENGNSITYFYLRDENHSYKTKNEFLVRQGITSPIVKTKLYKCKAGIFRVPSNAEGFLEEVYGANWRVPDPNWEGTSAIIEGRRGYMEKADNA
ncbi:LicD family protein [Roseburia hominis]